MKKTIMLLLVVALAFSCFALVFTAGAKTELVQGTQPEGKDYFMMNKELIKSFDFEDGTQPNKIDKFYSTLEVVSGDNAIGGNYSMKATGSDIGYPCNAWYFVSDYFVFTDRYYMQFDARMVGTQMSGIVVSASAGYTGNSDNLLMEAGLMAEYTDGKVTNYTANTGNVGWPVEDHWDTASFKATNLGNNVWRLYFEFTLPETTNAAAGLQIQFKHWGLDGTGAVVYDNIEIGKFNESKYYTIDYNADFETEATSTSTLWSVIGQISDQFTDSKAFVMDVDGTGADVRGLLFNGGEGKDAILGDFAGNVYFQFDVETTADTVEMYCLGENWFNVKYNGTAWTAEGTIVSAFKAEQKTEDVYTLSFIANFTNNPGAEVYIKTVAPGFIAFDNLIVAHEDNAPYVESGKTYNFSNPKDVQLNVELKGKTISEIKLDNVKLEESDYTLEGNILTVKAAKFATQTVGKAFALEVTTTGGTAKTEITQNDNRPTATVTASADLTKEYDGTTTFVPSEVTYGISGIQIGAKVELDCKVGQLASKNVGTTKLTITVALTGDDAWKYKLANDTVEVDVTITKKTVTLKATDTTKVYDGTTAANATLTVNGLEGNDQVTATATQTLANKNAGATKLQLTNIVLEGADKDNYAIAETTAEFDFTVTKKEITVKANAVSKDEKKADPELTYTVDGLISGDALSGALARQEGEKAGEYDITIGTLANDNYTINFTGAKLTINEAKGCFGVVGAASIGVFALIVAGAYVFTRKKND